MASRSAMMDDGYPSSSAPPAFDSQHEWEEHRRATIDDDRDELDLLGEDDINNNHNSHDNDDIILDEDPLRDDLNQPMSFKRKQKQSIFSQPSRLFSAFTGGRPSRDSHDIPGRPSPTSNTRLDGTQSGSKDGGPMDWYVEGPGRRVGYEDLTAIDWIFEYTKERQRLRMLSSGSNSLVGWIRLLLDNSQVWIVLLLTGLAAGLLAAAIDVATDWLADLKFGFCSTVDGGAFHLSKSSCCLGYEDHAQCQGWYPWAKAFGIHSGGGKWFIEYFFYVLLALSFAVSAAILVKEYAIHAKHSGIPEIKTVLGGFVIRRFLGIQTLVIKSLGLVLAVASGMWLGKEGPLVHVACCCANVFIKLFPSINNNEARKREILSAAAASGISVAFGSPIGGVLFSLEQLSYYFPDKTMWQSFVCAMTAAVTLQALDPFRSGKLVLYQVKYSSGWHGFELVPFVLLGILGGIYGGLFIKANMRVAEWKKSNTRWLPGPVTQVALVAGLTALINYPNTYMRAQTSELVSNLFTECAKIVDDRFGLCKTGAASFGTIALLIFAAVLGFFFAAVTFGLQIPAGIILPSMAIGALTGRALGILMELFQRSAPNFPLFLHQCEPDIPCITPGTYAIIGAAAFLAGVTRMTVSIVVITFELTGALTYVLPIMISVMISKWVGDAFSRRGIYESWIGFQSYPYLDPNNSGEDLSPLIPDVPASQIMTRLDSDLIVLTATGHTISSLTKILETTPYRGYPVISNPRDAILLGYISRAELSYILFSPHGRAAAGRLPPETECFFSHQPLADPLTTLDLRPWMDQTPLTLPGRSPLHLAVSYFQKLGVRYVLFAERGVLQGLLTRKDVWHVMNGAEERVRDAAGVEGAGGNGNGGGIGSGNGRMGGGRGREEGRGESAGLLGVERRDYFQGQGGTREGRSGSFAGSSEGSIL